MKFTSEVSLKIRTAIKVKLAELGNDVYEELPDYIMVMVANKKSEEQMTEDLALFLGENTEQFTSWLHSLLSKLQSVASVSVVKQTAPASAESDNGETYSHHSNGDASYATTGSDEASTSQIQKSDDATDHAEIRNTRADADRVMTPAGNATSITLLDDSDADDSDGSGRAAKRKSLQPEARFIKVKVRRVDRNSVRKRNSSPEATSSQKAKVENDHQQGSESNASQNEVCTETPEVKQGGGEVSSSMQQKEREDAKDDSNDSEEGDEQTLKKVQLKCL